MGRANFGGIVKQVCLEYTPEVEAGDYVLVHVGFALSKVDEDEAARTYQLLEEMKQLGELDVPDVDPFESAAATSVGHPERSRGTPLHHSEVTSRDGKPGLADSVDCVTASTPKAFGGQNDKPMI